MDIKSFAISFIKDHPDTKLTKNKAKVYLGNAELKHSTVETYILERFRKGLETPKNPISELYAGIKQVLLDNSHISLDPKYEKWQIGIDLFADDPILIIDGAAMPYNYSAWVSQIPKEQYELLLAESIEVVTGFHPDRGLDYEQEIDLPNGPEVKLHKNTYCPPTWKKNDNPNFTPFAPFIANYFESFFPAKDERDYCIWWLYKLMHERCEDVMVLVGTQGNGKSTFMNLASLCAGESNSFFGGKNFGVDKFNMEAFRNKLVCNDEFNLTHGKNEFLKTSTNDTITIEGKGSNPRKCQNHCSFIVANNNDENIFVEYRDRRFTIPQLSLVDLQDSMGLEHYTNLYLNLKTKEFKANFPHWVINYVEKNKLEYNKFRPFITARFWELVEASKPKWFLNFKHSIESRTVTLKQINSGLRIKINDLTVEGRIKLESNERRKRGLKEDWVTIERGENGDIYYTKLEE